MSSDSKPGNAENSASHIAASQSSGVTQNSSSSTATYQLSFYEQHKKAIWIGIVVVVAIVLIIVLATTLGAPEREIIGKYNIEVNSQTGMYMDFNNGFLFLRDSYVEIRRDTATMYLVGVIDNKPGNGTINFTSWEIMYEETDGKYILRFYDERGNNYRGEYYNGYLTLSSIPFVKE